MEGPSLSEVNGVIASLLASWDLAMADTTSPSAVGGTPEQIAVMLAVGCHAHETARLLQPALDGALRIVHAGLVRSVLESALTIAWLGRDPVATKAFMNESYRQENSLIDAMARSPLWSPSAQDIPKRATDNTYRDAQGRHLEQLAKDIGALDVYVMFRHLSGLAHVSARLTDSYLGPSDVAPFTLFPQGRLLESQIYFATTVAIALVWAGRPVDELHPDHPRHDALLQAARILQI